MRNSIKITVLFVIALGLILASSTPVLANTMGCPDRYYDSEKGCQLPIIMQYQAEKEKPVEVATIRDCPSRFFNDELGCQIPYVPKFSEEYALVKDEGKEYNIRGCPSRFFNNEVGCQIPYVIEYTH
jgi:hypothetical protein